LILSLLLVASAASPAPQALADADRGWVASHPTVRVALPLIGPFALLDNRGGLSGVSVDHLERLAALTGLRFENVPVVGVAAAIQGVREGRFDVVMGIGRTRDREDLLLFGKPFAFSPDAIVGPTEAPFLFDIHELGNRRVALARSSVDLVRRFATQVPDAQVVLFETMDEAMLAVERREAHVAVVDASYAAWFVKQRRLADLRVSGIFDSSPDMYIGVRRDWPELVRILDRALAAIPAAERTQIINRWMVLDYESDRRWRRAFRASAGVVAIVLLVAVLLAAMGHRMRRELALRRRIQAELEEARDRLTRASADKSDLMRMMAHDLRNPMCALLLTVDDLLGEVPRGEVQASLSDMRATLDRMSSLLAQLTDAHALESGARAYRWTRIDAGEEVRAAAQAAAGVAQAKGIEVVATVPPSLPALESDLAAFREIVDNLLSNAVKYAPSGSRVQADAAATEGAIRIAVRDQGPGVPAAERLAIFEKYAMGSARPTRSEPSTGLGLWIVDRLVRAMSGRVWCEDAPGGGAAFCVELPLARQSGGGTLGGTPSAAP
jgi:signal transduction histidine kinase